MPDERPWFVYNSLTGDLERYATPQQAERIASEYCEDDSPSGVCWGRIYEQAVEDGNLVTPSWNLYPVDPGDERQEALETARHAVEDATRILLDALPTIRSQGREPSPLDL